MTLGTAWEAGRFDARAGPPRILFGRMYEDHAIEQAAFRGAGRVFCIASAGCSALQLARDHDVVAVDINRAQLDYAARRVAGGPMLLGSAEKIMRLGRLFLPLAGWTRSRIREFLDLETPSAQYEYWRSHLDTQRFRRAIDALFSVTNLRRAYASPLVAALPQPFGAVMHARLGRCFRNHPNRTNPWARALLAGELDAGSIPAQADRIALVHADAATYLESMPPASFEGFTLSNVLDGADRNYRLRLANAVRRAAAPGAVVVLRSFAEPSAELASNRASEDRSILWGIVDVRPAERFAP